MKYNISINQHSVMKNESLRNLDLIDLVLFDFVYHFICADFNDKRTMVYKGVVYTQIKQKLVEIEMPLLNIGTSRTFINRMNKLIDANLIKRYPHNQKEGVSYFTKGDNFSIMVFSEPTKIDSHPTKGDAESCENDFTPPTKIDSHNNSIYNNINIINNKKDIDKSISKESEIEVENFGEETITPTNKETPKEKSSAKKEKVIGATIEERAIQFYDELSGYVGKYPKEIIRAFYDYWTEKNRSKTKMKFEQQQTWETSLRLARWYHNNKNKTTNNYGKQSNDEFGNGTAIGKANREQYEGETTA